MFETERGFGSVMNQFTIFLVQNGASQQDFEDALRDHGVALEIVNDLIRIEVCRSSVADNDQMPLWSWFFRSCTADLRVLW